MASKFKVGDFVQFRNVDPDSYFNQPSRVLAILPSGLIKHGKPTCFSNSDPRDLIPAHKSDRRQLAQ